MGKIPMESSSGDLGARASEDALKTTPKMSDAFGSSHMPDLGKAMGYMKKNDCRMGKTMGGKMDKD